MWTAARRESEWNQPFCPVRETARAASSGRRDKEQIESAAGPVLVDKGLTEEDEVPISPGMKYTHYAPSAPMAIADGGARRIQELADTYKSRETNRHSDNRRERR